MNKLIKSIPIPLAGLALGLVALGNLLQSYSEIVRTGCAVLSTILFLMVTLKLIFYRALIVEDLKNSVQAGVFATYPMSLALLSVFWKPYLGNSLAMTLWYLAIAIHVLLIIYFTKTFMVKLDLSKVFASNFIVYVGIAVIGITAPAYGMATVGAWTVYFALCSIIVLFPLVTKRYLSIKTIAEPVMPLICIFAAPISLTLAGYLASVENKSLVVVVTLLLLATTVYFFVLTRLFSLLKLKFYPSFAAFTFPFVITAIATKQATAFLAKAGFQFFALKYLVIAETLIALILVAYTGFHFLRQMGRSLKPEQ